METFRIRLKAGDPARGRFRASGLNLAVTDVILWNTVYLSRAVAELRAARAHP